ncbi:hypothetical protein IU421_06935 [Nocardia cyriacigeorgica]|uniref:TPR repeat region-containing protein n=1 Tax=Nocardia cyriacigeorgica TaxID=135487 RepID=UPI00189529F2|nr:hypothetical protein [Nocardia cyriacigeorgica]MBF6514018.1 hypothetical protein [Nocardia cyriacigeorgica]
MAPATRSQAESCNPDALSALISEWASARDTLQLGLDKTSSSYQGSSAFWEGKTADRARDTVSQVVSAGRRVVTDLTNAVTVLQQDQNAIWAAKNKCIQAISTATAAKYDVGDDGSVRPSKDAEAAAISSIEDPGKQTAAISALWKHGRDTLEPPIKTALAELGTAVEGATGSIRKAFENSPDVAAIAAEAPGKLDPSKQLTAEQGIADGETIADGKLSEDEKQRILENLRKTNLTPEQLIAIQNGQEVTVPASTMAYLENLYGKAGFNGLTELSNTLKSDSSPDGQALRRELATGMLTLSNEQVTSRNPDGSVNSRGGFTKLDPKVQFMTGTRFAGPDANTEDYPDGYRDNFNDSPEVAHGKYFQDMASFSDFLGAANPDYQPGDRFGVELGRQAAHQAWIDDHGTGIYGDTGRKGAELPWVQESGSVATQFLDVSSRNQEASHALLTGIGSDELFGKGTPGQSWHPYSASDTVGTLMTHEWNDDGRALSSMVSWAGDQAYDPDPIKAERAGQAAHSLADIMATTKSNDGTNIYQSLLDMPGQDRKSFGEVNPLAAQGIAASLAPYTADMVGAPASLTGTHGFTSDLGPADVTRVFSALDGDPTASATINGAALARAEQIDRYFASAAVLPGDSEPLELGTYSGRLRGTVDAGLNAHVADLNLNETDRAKEISDQRSAAYGVVQNLIGLSGAAGPVGAVGGPMAQALIEIPKNPLTSVDPEYGGRLPGSSVDGTEYDLNRSGTVGDRRYNLFSQLIATGQISPYALPDELQQTVFSTSDDGSRHLKPYIAATPDDASADVLERYLPDILDSYGISREDQTDYLNNGDKGRDSFAPVISNGTIDGQHELKRLFTDELEQQGYNTWPR